MIDLETGDLSQATSTKLSSGAVLEAVAGSAYSGSYGLHAGYTNLACFSYSQFIHSLPMYANGHLWIWGRLRINSKSNGTASAAYHSVCNWGNSGSDPAGGMGFSLTIAPNAMLLELRSNTELIGTQFPNLTAGFHKVKLHLDTTGPNDVVTCWIDDDKKAEKSASGHITAGGYTYNALGLGPVITWSDGTASCDISWDDVDYGDTDPDLSSSTTLVVAKCSQSQVAENVTLATLGVLSPVKCSQSQVADNIALTYHPPITSSRIFDHRHVDASGISQEKLDAARSLKILFGHQSVGVNILDGLSDLATSSPSRYAISRSSNPTIAWFDEVAGLGDFSVGVNGNPQGKVDDFVDHVDTQDWGSHIDVAIMKLCWVDLSPDTIYTGHQVWDMYRPAMESLISAYPNVVFVWTTDPIYINNNSERYAFNSLVRDYVDANGGWLLDIADIEAYEPGGVSHTDGGYPALYDGYTTDGGHLNDAAKVGRDRVANAWWTLMSEIAGMQLSVDECNQTQVAENVTLTYHPSVFELTIADGNQTQIVEGELILTQHHVLTVQKCYQTQHADSLWPAQVKTQFLKIHEKIIPV